MTVKERVDEIIVVRNRFIDKRNTECDGIIFINQISETGIHIFKGIRKLARELGVEIQESPYNGETFKRKLWFTYKSTVFFEFQKEGEIT